MANKNFKRRQTSCDELSMAIIYDRRNARPLLVNSSGTFDGSQYSQRNYQTDHPPPLPPCIFTIQKFNNYIGPGIVINHTQLAIRTQFSIDLHFFFFHLFATSLALNAPLVKFITRITVRNVRRQSVNFYFVGFSFD